jgi:DNA repair exonuclease SbcCD ATPase subunit
MADESIIVDLKAQGVKDLVDGLGLASKGLSELDKGLIEANKQLATLDKGSEEFKKLSKEINAANTAITAYGQSSDTLKKELRETTNEIGALDRSIKALEKTNQTGTQSYKNLVSEQENLKKKAGELKDTITDLNAEIKNSGSDTKNLDKALRAIGAVAAGYQIAQGALVLFGSENKKFEQALLKLNAVMAITNGLQQIQNELSKKDSLFTAAASSAKKAYASAVAFATGATTAFGVAIRALGLGLFIGAVALLVTNWERLKEAISGAVSETDKLIKAKEKALAQSQRAIDSLEQELKFQVAIGKLTEKQALEKAISAKKEAELAASQLQSAQLQKFSELLKASKTYHEEITSQSQDGVTTSKLVANATQKQVNDQAEAWKKAKVAYQDLVVSRVEDEKKLEKLNKPDKDTSKEKVKIAKEREKDLKIIAANLKENIQEIFNEDVDLFPTKAQDRSKKYFTDIIAALERVVDNVEIGSDRWIYLNDQISKTKKLMDTIALSEEQVTKNAKESTDTIIQETFKKQDVKNKAFFEDLLKRKEDLKDEKLTQQDKLVIANASANALFQITAGISEFRKQTLDNELASGIISEKKYQEELRKIKRQEAIANKVQAVFNISLSIAEAIVKALTAGPIIGQVLAGITAGLGFAQLALVLATPIPKFAKGVIDLQDEKKPNGVDTVPAMLSKGESVMTVSETKEHKDVLTAIRKGTFNKLFIPKSNLIQPDIFANIPNPAMIDKPLLMDKDDYSSINTRLDKVASELWWLTSETKKGNKLRERGTDKVVKAVQSKSKRYV